MAWPGTLALYSFKVVCIIIIVVVAIVIIITYYSKNPHPHREGTDCSSSKCTEHKALLISNFLEQQSPLHAYELLSKCLINRPKMKQSLTILELSSNISP